MKCLWGFFTSCSCIRRSGYNCVIYGWDPKCSMSPEWIATMRVHQLTHGANQPFYNVLVQDGTCRYAAQGELKRRRTGVCAENTHHTHTHRLIFINLSFYFPFISLLLSLSFCVENLEPHSAPLEISHPEVGRYFSDFSDTHYAANEELQSHYPEDTAETQKAVQELYHSHGLDSGHAAGSNTDHTTTRPSTP